MKKCLNPLKFSHIFIQIYYYFYLTKIIKQERLKNNLHIVFLDQQMREEKKKYKLLCNGMCSHHNFTFIYHEIQYNDRLTFIPKTQLHLFIWKVVLDGICPMESHTCISSIITVKREYSDLRLKEGIEFSNYLFLKPLGN